jgi:hypothetical protein
VNYYGKNVCCFRGTLHETGALSALKGNNSCKTQNFRMKVGNVLMSDLLSPPFIRQNNKVFIQSVTVLFEI